LTLEYTEIDAPKCCLLITTYWRDCDTNCLDYSVSFFS